MKSGVESIHIYGIITECVVVTFMMLMIATSAITGITIGENLFRNHLDIIMKLQQMQNILKKLHLDKTNLRLRRAP